MKRFLAWASIFGAAMWLSPGPLRAEGPALGQAIRSALAARPHPEVQYGVCVLDLDGGDPLFEAKADLSLVPASTMKTLVMAAALERLGPGFAFETHLATDGTNLYLVGSGDPRLGDPRLAEAREEEVGSVFQRWAVRLVESGVKSIPGKLIIDDTIFDDERIHPSWEASDLGKWYAAPVGGLNFNDNCVDIVIEPADRAGGPVIVSVTPDCPAVVIVNKCLTGPGGDPVLHHPAGTFEYRISGRCTKRWRFPAVAFPDPGLLTADTLRRTLERGGVSIGGGLYRGRVRLADGSLPPAMRILATHRTPLVDVLERIGKHSQNLFAECLLKRLGYEWARAAGVDGAQGTWATGAHAVEAQVEAMGIDTAGLVISDGSGLSRDNRCTARQLATLLAHMDRSAHRDIFREALSEAGADGSLRRRLRDMPGQVHAKTGTMRGVRALCGYVNGTRRRYAFAIIFNGYRGPSTPYKEIQDRICRVLAER